MTEFFYWKDAPKKFDFIHEVSPVIRAESIHQHLKRPHRIEFRVVALDGNGTRSAKPLNRISQRGRGSLAKIGDEQKRGQIERGEVREVRKHPLRPCQNMQGPMLIVSRYVH